VLEALLGDQRPRLENRPDAVASYGDMAVDFAAAAGLPLDDWEQYVLWAVHDVDERNRWAAREFGLLVSRQNGKSEILCAYDLCRLFLFPLPDLRRRTVLHTAHEVKTATESFEKLQAVVEGSARLMSMVKHIYTANGKEAILLRARKGQLLGDRIRFIARSTHSGRGFMATDIVYDEAQQLKTSARSALTYTSTTVPNRQELFFGTVPNEENDGEVFEGVRDRGRAGAKRTGWMEWSPDGSEDPKSAKVIDPRSERVWRQGVPALGIRIEADTVAEQVEAGLMLDRDDLMRERFSVWPSRPADEKPKLSELDIQAWARGAGDHPVVKSGVIAVALGRGGGYATVAAAQRTGEKIAVEHKKTALQTRWVAEYVRDLKKELGDALIVLDAKNAAPIIAALDQLRVKYLSMNLDEIAAAHSLFIEYVNDGQVVHRDQPEVTKSLETATTRAIGRAGLTWEPSDPKKPISHAQAVTWAVWGVLKSESSPRKPAIVRGYA
jgi:hypothetical protein